MLLNVANSRINNSLLSKTAHIVLIKTRGSSIFIDSLSNHTSEGYGYLFMLKFTFKVLEQSFFSLLSFSYVLGSSLSFNWKNAIPHMNRDQLMKIVRLNI